MPAGIPWHAAKMRFEETVEVDADIATVRPVLFDLESWPSMTESIDSLERVDAGPLRVGSRVRLKQPRLPGTEWTVTEVSEDAFTYESKSLGMRVVARHELAPRGSGTSLRLALDMTGPLSPVVGRLGGSLTRKYIEMEAQGLKAAAEA